MKRSQKSGKVSLSSLSRIAPEETQIQDEASEQDASESLSTAFSLLSTVLASPEFAMSQETQALLESIKEHLDQLIPLLPSALSKPATTSSMLLEIQLTSPENDATKPTPPHITDLETHRQALANLNSDLPPVQAEGFSLLSKLILKSSPILDIPSTLTLLLSIIPTSPRPLRMTNSSISTPSNSSESLPHATLALSSKPSWTTTRTEANNEL